MARIQNVLRARLVVVFDDVELPCDAIELGTVNLPATLSVSDDQPDPGSVKVDIDADTSVFHRLADFLRSETDRGAGEHIRAGIFEGIQGSNWQRGPIPAREN